MKAPLLTSAPSVRKCKFCSFQIHSCKASRARRKLEEHMKKTHPVDDGTQVEGGNQKMPVMGYEDNESDFDQKWMGRMGGYT